MNLITINNQNYDADQLSPEGQRLLSLISAAQNEITRLETQKTLMNAAQQQLINQLIPLLPHAVPNNVSASAEGILGEASDEIPTTSVKKPDNEPSPLPDALPDSVRAKP